ncbi:hypothetical protein FRB95_011300 [Tulasnella sp. JGI-2019a]|nr:hypothetical protein FRB95_011300 [Tulasnella sp. JGI-2019a]
MPVSNARYICCSGCGEGCMASTFGTAQWIGLCIGLGAFIVFSSIAAFVIIRQRNRIQRDSSTTAVDPESAFVSDNVEGSEALPVYVSRPPCYEQATTEPGAPQPPEYPPSSPPKAYIIPRSHLSDTCALPAEA